MVLCRIIAEESKAVRIFRNVTNNVAEIIVRALISPPPPGLKTGGFIREGGLIEGGGGLISNPKFPSRSQDRGAY